MDIITCPTCQGMGKVDNGRDVIINNTARFNCAKCGAWVILTPFNGDVSCRCGEIYRWAVWSDDALKKQRETEPVLAAMREALCECRDQILLLVNSNEFADRDLDGDKLLCLKMAEQALAPSAGKAILERLKRAELAIEKSSAIRRNLRCISHDIIGIINAHEEAEGICETSHLFDTGA